MQIPQIGIVIMTIDPSLFPVPDSPYCTNGLKFDKFVPITLLAFHLQLVNSEGNLHHDQRKKGYYFFRDSSVPHPRPATQLAWERICRLGKLRSESFIVPFLPALREEDEAGQAIAERGIHVASLSRRSPLHHKEIVRISSGKVFEAIIWGDCYIGSTASDSSSPHTTLVGHLERSNVVESLVLPQRDIDGVTAQESIRGRLEFLAQFGIPATSGFAKIAGVPRIHRLLFQFLGQETASSWADSYRRAFHAIRRDPGLIEADYRDMLADMVEKRRKVEESQESKPVAKENEIITKKGFTMDMGDFSL